MRWLPTLLIGLMLASCGFEPVYQQHAGKLSGADILQHVQIETVAGRAGDQFKAIIEDRFYQFEKITQPRYKLVTTLNVTSRAFIIDPDGISSRYEVTAQSHYQVLRASDNAPLHSGNMQRQVSYNVSEEDDYATYIAARDAKTQAVDVLADDLARRVAVLLAQASQ